LRRWTLPLRGEMQLPLWGPQAGTWFASATSDGDSAWLLVALDTAPAHGELTLRPAATVDWEWHGDDGELRLLPSDARGAVAVAPAGVRVPRAGPKRLAARVVPGVYALQQQRGGRWHRLGTVTIDARGAAFTPAPTGR